MKMKIDDSNYSVHKRIEAELGKLIKESGRADKPRITQKLKDVRVAWEVYSRSETQRREKEDNLRREVDRVDKMAAQVVMETERLRKLKDEAMNVVKNLDLRNSAEYDEFCHPPVYDRVLHPGDLGRLYQDLELEEVGEMRLTDLIDNFKTRKSSYGLGFPLDLPYPPHTYSTHPLDHRLTRPGSTGHRRPRSRPPRSQSQEDGRDYRSRFEISERRRNYGDQDIYEKYDRREGFNDPQDSTEEDDQSHQYNYDQGYRRRNYEKDHDKRKKEERRNNYEMYDDRGNNKHEKYNREYRKMYKNKKEDTHHVESDQDRRTHSNEIQKPNMDSKYWIRDSRGTERGRREERRYKEEWRKDRRSGEDWQTGRRLEEDSDSQLNFLEDGDNTSNDAGDISSADEHDHEKPGKPRRKGRSPKRPKAEAESKNIKTVKNIKENIELPSRKPDEPKETIIQNADEKVIEPEPAAEGALASTNDPPEQNKEEIRDIIEIPEETKQEVPPSKESGSTEPDLCLGSENVDDKLYSPESDSTTEPEPKPEPSTVPGLESKKNSVDRERKTGSVAMADAYKQMLMGGFKRPEPQPAVEDDSTSDDIEAELAAYARPAARKPPFKNMKFGLDDDEQNFNAESSNSEEEKKKNAGAQPTAEDVQFSGLGMGLVGSFAGVGGGNFPGVGGGSRHPVPVAFSQGISKGIVGGKLGHPAAQRAANLAMSSSKIVLNSDSDGLGPDQGLSGKPDLKDGNISGPEKDEDDDFWN